MFPRVTTKTTLPSNMVCFFWVPDHPESSGWGIRISVWTQHLYVIRHRIREGKNPNWAFCNYGDIKASVVWFSLLNTWQRSVYMSVSALAFSAAQQSCGAGTLVLLRLPTQTKKFINSISHFSIKWNSLYEIIVIYSCCNHSPMHWESALMERETVIWKHFVSWS